MKVKKALVGIRVRLILSILIPLVLIITALGAFLTVQVGSIVKDLKTETITQQVDVAVLEAEKFFNSSFTGAYMTSEMNSVVVMVAEAERSSKDFDGRTSANLSALMADLNKVAANLGDGVAVWLTTTNNGQLLQTPAYYTEVGFDYGSRPWYQLLAANPGEPAVTGAYEDVATGNQGFCY